MSPPFSSLWKSPGVWRLRRFLFGLAAHGAARLVHAVVKLWLRTCTVEVSGQHHLRETAAQGPCLLSIWHNRVLPIPHLLSQLAEPFSYTALISNSRDGDLIAAIVSSYPNGHSLRVAHRDRAQAIRDSILCLRKGNVVVITPDGPRGPRFRVKPGILVAATRAPAKVVGMTWAADRFWQIPTWDQMMLPKPFSRIVIRFSSPFSVSRKWSPKEMAEALEKHLRHSDLEALRRVLPSENSWPR